MNSDYNQGIKAKEDKANPEINAYGFQEGYVLPTTMEQDRIVEDKFINAVQGISGYKTEQSARICNKEK